LTKQSGALLSKYHGTPEQKPGHYEEDSYDRDQYREGGDNYSGVKIPFSVQAIKHIH
jgi:hypothetical protein